MIPYSVQPSSSDEIYKSFGIKGGKEGKIQFSYGNIDLELRACVTKSNLFVICLFIQFSRECQQEKVKWPGNVNE